MTSKEEEGGRGNSYKIAGKDVDGVTKMIIMITMMIRKIVITIIAM